MDENHLEDTYYKHLFCGFSSATSAFSYFLPGVCFSSRFSPTHTSRSQTVTQPNAAPNQTTARCSTSNSELSPSLTTCGSSGSFLSYPSTAPPSVLFCCSPTFCLPTPSSVLLFDSFFFLFLVLAGCVAAAPELKVNKWSFFGLFLLEKE